MSGRQEKRYGMKNPVSVYSTSVSTGSSFDRQTKPRREKYAIKFVPNQHLLYGSVNCKLNHSTNESNELNIKHRNRSKTDKAVLLELSRLCHEDEYVDNGRMSKLVGISELQDVNKYGCLKSTCLSFCPSESANIDDNVILCATGLDNGSLCVHDFNMNQQDIEGSHLSKASISFYPAKNSRPATAVAWRPKRKTHVAVGLSSHRKIGRGDREFCCLLWDIESQKRGHIPHAHSEDAHVYSGIAPAHRFSHNTSVASLSWLEANVLAVGTFQKIQLYDIRMAGTNTPPVSKVAHNDIVAGIEVDPYRTDLQVFATFSDGASDPVKVWDARNMDMPFLEIKTSNFGGRTNTAHVVSSIEWFGMASLAITCADTIRIFDTQSNRPVLTSLYHSQSDVQCVAFPFTQKIDDNKFGTHDNGLYQMIHPRRLVLVNSDGIIETLREVHGAPLSTSCNTKFLSTAYGNKMWVDELPAFALSEDISCLMMKRAKCLHVHSYSTNPDSNLKMLYEELHMHKNCDDDFYMNNKRLWRLWNWIKRVENLSNDAFVMIENGKQPQWPTLSLTTSGILQLLRDRIDDDKEKSSESLQCKWFDSPMRSMALVACGWAEIDGKQDIAKKEEEEGHFERSAALHVFYGDLGSAVEVLQRGAEKVLTSKQPQTQAKEYSEVIYLIAMCIAGFNAKSDVWRKACTTILEREVFADKKTDFDTSYLKAACSFLCAVGNEAEIESILFDESICITHRVAFACRFIPRSDLLIYLEKTARKCIEEGDLEGIILTGFDRACINLLQSYLDNSGDIQTVALLSSRVILPKDWVFERYQCTEWLNSYRDLLNIWQMWHSRSKFDVGRANLLRNLEKRISVNPNVSKESVTNVPTQLYARCNYCNASINLDKLRRHEGIGNSWLSRQNPQLNCCPQCRKPLPRCSICLLPMGCLNPYLELKRERNSIASGMKRNVRSDLSPLANIQFAEWWTWCINCKHGGHAHHLIGWFTKHDVCPVSGCSCKCQFDAIPPISCHTATTK